MDWMFSAIREEGEEEEKWERVSITTTRKLVWTVGGGGENCVEKKEADERVREQVKKYYTGRRKKNGEKGGKMQMDLANLKSAKKFPFKSQKCMCL